MADENKPEFKVGDRVTIQEGTDTEYPEYLDNEILTVIEVCDGGEDPALYILTDSAGCKWRFYEYDLCKYEEPTDKNELSDEFRREIRTIEACIDRLGVISLDELYRSDLAKLREARKALVTLCEFFGV
jgi:hypothetical protein